MADRENVNPHLEAALKRVEREGKEIDPEAAMARFNSAF